ncbi:hypothetical protein D3C71_1644610 [compost metagenome]
MGDVEVQGQLWRLRGALRQVHGQAAVVGALRMQGCQPVGQWRPRQACAAFEPGGAVAAVDAQGQVGLVAQFIAQGGQARLQLGWGGDAGELGAEQRQARVQQLLVQFDEVLFAGPAEYQAGAERDSGSAGGEQQGQAAAE